MRARGRLTSGLTLGSLVIGGSIAHIGLVPAAVAAVAGMVVFGAGYTVADVVAESLLQRSAPDHVLARVFGVVEALSVAMAASLSQAVSNEPVCQLSTSARLFSRAFGLSSAKQRSWSAWGSASAWLGQRYWHG